MSENLLFVYGTLMSGERNHHYLRDCQFIGKGITRPSFELFDFGPYPAMVACGKRAVHGEIYAVGEDTLVQVDQLEGHPGYYKRGRIVLVNDSEVWAYLLRPERIAMRPRILSGNWKARNAIGLHMW